MPEMMPMQGAPPAAGPAPAEGEGGNELEQILGAGHQLLASLAKALEDVDPALAEQAGGILADYDGLAKAVAQGGNAAAQPSEGPARGAKSMAPSMVGGSPDKRPLL